MTGSQRLQVIDLMYDSEYVNGAYIYDESLPHSIIRNHRYLYLDFSVGLNYYLREDQKGLYFSLAPNIYLFQLYETSDTGFNESVKVSRTDSDIPPPNTFSKLTSHLNIKAAYAFRIWNKLEFDIGIFSALKMSSFYEEQNISNRWLSAGLSLGVIYILTN